MADRASPVAARQRLDRWLFFSRAVKSRTLAQKLIAAGLVRVNAERTLDADHAISPGDVLTMTLGTRLAVWRVTDTGVRRGPPAEARALYEDLSPILPRPPDAAPRDGGASRQ